MRKIHLTDQSAVLPGVFRKAGAIVLAVLAAGVALMFSAVLLSILLIIGAIALAYFWWKTREVRKLMRDMQQFQDEVVRSEGKTSRMQEERGIVIEGEAVRVDTKRDMP